MVRVLQGLVLALILLQRFAVPVGDQQVALLVPLVSLLVVVAALAGGFTVDRRRLVLVTIVALVAAVLTLAQIVAGIVPSVLSLVLLLVLYVPAVLSPRGDATTFAAVGRFFVRLMGVVAIVSVVEFVAQALGRGWPDLLTQVVPPQLLLQDFNPGNPITYGSSIDRATAIVFLEPSFLSLLLGVAVVIALRLHMSWPLVTLLLIGIVPTVAGNGVVVIGAAFVVLLFTKQRRRLAALVPALVLAAVAAAATPLGPLFVERSTEGGGADSSSGLRFVQPYLQLIPPSLEDPLHALIGRGAGAAQDYIARLTTDPLLATAFPKVLFEFGLVGLVGVLLPIVILFTAPLRRHPEMIGLVAAYLVVNASLQTPLVVYLMIVVMLWLPDLEERPESSAPTSEPLRIREPEPVA